MPLTSPLRARSRKEEPLFEPGWRFSLQRLDGLITTADLIVKSLLKCLGDRGRGLLGLRIFLPLLHRGDIPKAAGMVWRGEQRRGRGWCLLLGFRLKAFPRGRFRSKAASELSGLFSLGQFHGKARGILGILNRRLDGIHKSLAPDSGLPSGKIVKKRRLLKTLRRRILLRLGLGLIISFRAANGIKLGTIIAFGHKGDTSYC